jgi:uncharacterized phosphosugar-binding protein
LKTGKEGTMKRREMLALIPAGIAGVSGVHGTATAAGGCCNIAHDLKSKPLALQYMARVREMLMRIRHTQSENILEASHAVAGTQKSGGTNWCIWDMGHSAKADVFPGRNGEPEIFVHGYEADRSKKGDLLLTDLGEYPPFDDIMKKEITVIGGPCAWGGDSEGTELLLERVQKMVVRPYAHIWIENYITVYGAIMNIPGMAAPIGPLSGVLGMVTYWMILADACRLLARDDISVAVKGDEPPLADEHIPPGQTNSRVSLYDPLMDNYFDRIMYEIEMIEAEMGDIQKIARMAVDSILAGGKVYCYSRYPDFLASEASYRRGGLCLTRGLYDNNGEIAYSFPDTDRLNSSGNDCVIMGISRPDDPVDLGHLDTFRSHNMNVASIGPMNRDISVPEGRTVPKETDTHVGRMCDTYGLFAVPGFKRKVCPTSGVLLNQMFWAICMEIVEELVRRTGNAPGVLFNSALKKGRKHNHRMYEIYLERGY